MIRQIPDIPTRLEDAEDLLHAMRSGEVDALIVSGPNGDHVYTLSGSEPPYRVVLEAMSEGAVMLTTQGAIVYSNRSFAALTGTSLTQVIGAAMTQFVAADDLPHYDTLIRQANTGVGRGEVRLTRSGGWAFPARLSISSFESGGSSGFCVVVTDLTGHERQGTGTSVETLEQAECLETDGNQRRIRNMLESATDSFVALDHLWRISDVNQLAAATFGRMREDLVGRVFWDLTLREHPDVEEQYRRAMIERVIIHHDGPSIIARNRWLEQHIYPTDAGLAIYFRDITERRRADDRLRRNDTLLAEAQRIGHTGDWVLNVATGALSWSVEHYHLWGVDPSRFTLTLQAARGLMHAEDRDAVNGVFDVAIRESTDFERTFRIIRPDGQVRQMFTIGHPVFSDTGEVTEYVGTVMDVTDRNADEATRKELSRRLIAAQEDERRHIAREMHDQFGQQLSALVLKVSGLKRQIGRRARLAEQLESLEVIARQLDRDLEHIVGRLRPTALDDLGLAAALTHYVEHWSRHFNVPVEMHRTGMECGRLTTELETALYRITQEALNNVAKHAHATHVSVLLDLRPDRVSIIIEDDGVGFEAEQPDSTRERFGVIGMRERAAISGGALDIESRPGNGTTVVARIPLRPD